LVRELAAQNTCLFPQAAATEGDDGVANLCKAPDIAGEAAATDFYLHALYNLISQK